MGKIILEIDRHSGMQVEYKTLEKDCIQIGRGFDNDVIISDPFVEARHVCIRLNDNAWTCEDLGGVNGTFLLGREGSGDKVRVNGVASLGSGDSISIGKTIIRVWASQHPVEPARVMPVARVPPFFAYQSKTGLNLFFSLLAFYCVYYFVFSHMADRKDMPVMMILAQETAVLICLVAWSGMWAVITRFAKHQHRMAQHLAFTCQWCILNYIIGVILKYIIFFACNQVFGVILSFIAFGAMGIFILNVHMAIGTNMSPWKRWLISGSTMLAIIGLCGMLYYGLRGEFESEPKHFINLVPVPEFMIPTIPIADEIKRLDTVFQK